MSIRESTKARQMKEIPLQKNRILDIVESHGVDSQLLGPDVEEILRELNYLLRNVRNAIYNSRNECAMYGKDDVLQILRELGFREQPKTFLVKTVDHEFTIKADYSHKVVSKNITEFYRYGVGIVGRVTKSNKCKIEEVN